MISLIAMALGGIVLQALTLDWARARADENPERHKKYANGFWGGLRLQAWFPRIVPKELSARQLGRMLGVAWAVVAGLLAVTILLDAALWGWESRLASHMGWG